MVPEGNEVTNISNIENSKDGTYIALKEPVSDYGTVLLCALRYALGRQTYITGVIAGYIAPKIPFLDDRTIKIMERDITEAIRTDRIGDPRIDLAVWRELQEKLKAEIEKRG